MFSNRITSRRPRRLLFVFEILAFALLFAQQGDFEDTYSLATGIMLILIIYMSNFLLLKITSGDNYIFLIATMLISIGLIMIYRIDKGLGTRQLVWLALGILSFFLTYFILKNIRIWEKLTYLYIGAIYLLFLLTFALGQRQHGSINWISIAGINFQPAEIMKILLVFIIASYYSNYDKFQEKKYASYYFMGIIYSFVGLLFLQRDLGMATIFYGIFIVLQFIYEKDRKLILLNLGLFLILAVIGYFLFSHVQIRVETWINPWAHMNDKGYQITQSLFAIAEGGFFGKGIGLGYPHFIPLSYNDFIFSAICEEMGVFTGIGIIMLFMILVYRGFKIGINQRNQFFRVVALGISVLFGIQSIVIIGGVIKLIPLTGITLPFVSYGGSSILTSFIALGILQVSSEDNMVGE